MDAELRERILSELEEAGEENIPTLANTVFDATGIEVERSQLKAALLSLVESGLVRVAVERDNQERLIEISKEESLGILKDIERSLVFSNDRNCWTGGPRPWPEIVLTDQGAVAARGVLDARGYQWWRRGDHA